MVVWFAHVRVGHRQALNTKSPSILDVGAFLFGAPGMARSALTGAVPVQVVLAG